MLAFDASLAAAIHRGRALLIEPANHILHESLLKLERWRCHLTPPRITGAEFIPGAGPGHSARIRYRFIKAANERE
jgi:hypothetical protein